MNNRTLEIILKLKDELTKKLTGVQGALRQFGTGMKELAKDLKRVGSDLQHVGGFFIAFGATLTGPLALAFNNSAKYSRAVTVELEHSKTVASAFQLTLANALVPVMTQINNLLGKAYTAWMDLGEVKQRAIVQTVFLTGFYSTLGGVIFRVLGSVMKTIGTVITLAMRLNPVTVAILSIVSAIALMIQYWDQVRSTAIPVLNAIEAGISAIASGYATLLSMLVKEMAFLIGFSEKFINLLAKIPGPQQAIFKTISSGLDNARNALDKFSVYAQEVADNLAVHSRTTWNGMEGVAVSSMDNISKKFEEFKKSFSSIGSLNFDALKAQLDAAQANANLWADTMKSISQQTAQSMTNSFSTLFFDAFTGQLKSAKDYFADFGRSILQILSQALAKLILVKTIGAAFPGMAKFFHQGGVVRAHSGYLASDEVPIIAQSGEGIISRRGMAALGASNLQRLNRGEGGGGQGDTYQPVVVIQAWDTQDLMRNRKSIEGIIANAMRNNSSVRGAVRAYG